MGMIKGLKDLGQLLQKDAWTLLLFELLYKTLAGAVLFPLLLFLFDFAMKLCGFSYLTNDNILIFLQNPITLIILLVLLLLAALYVMVEMVSLTVCFDVSRRNQPLGVWELFFTGFKKSWPILHPKNFILVLFVMLIIPMTNVALASGLITAIKIPEFIMDFINQAPFLSFAFAGLIGIFMVTAVNWIFIFNCFVMEGKGPKAAAQASRQLIAGKFWRTLGYLVAWNLFLAGVSLSTYFIVVGLLAIGVSLLQLQSTSLAVFLSLFNVLNLLVLFFINLLSIPANYALITSLYYRYRQEKGLPVPQAIVVEKTAPINPRLVKGGSVLLLVLALVLNSFYIYGVLNQGLLDDATLLQKTQVTSHRGNSLAAPENTLIALEYAVKDLADWAEIDVQQTKDGQLVVLHDSNLKRTTGLDKNIWEVTYQEIQDLDAGSWFDPRFSQARVPLLAQVLEYSQNRIRLNIELKPSEQAQGFGVAVVALLRQYGLEKQCVITSLNYDILKQVKALAPELKTGYILTVAYGDFYDLPDVDFFSVEASFITDKMVRELHHRGKEIHAWTLNQEESIRALHRLQVDNIITDNPVLAKEVIYLENNKTRFNQLLGLVFD